MSWSYRVVPVEPSRSGLQYQLDMLGAEGWDLISYVEGNLVFKKPNSAPLIHRILDSDA